MKKLVSVIIPVYNVEKYIYQCIDSLRKQDYENIEIIAVDDGSPDNSGKIVEEISKQDDRIKIIHKKNEGVSLARNAGIDIAIGEYIMFVDGDDWVEKNYVSYFVNLIESCGTEIGMNKNNFSINKSKDSDEKYVVSAEKGIEWLYSGDVFVAVWNKIYSMKLLKNNKVKFNNEIWYGEGMLFNIECLQFVQNVAIGECSVYHQTYNPDSAMRKFNLKSNLNGIYSLEVQKSKWIKKNEAIEKAWRYHKFCFNRSIINGIVRSGSQDKYNQILKDCKKNLRKDILIGIKTENKIRKKFGWIAYYISPKFMAKRDARKHFKNIKKSSNEILYSKRQR